MHVPDMHVPDMATHIYTAGHGYNGRTWLHMCTAHMPDMTRKYHDIEVTYEVSSEEMLTPRCSIPLNEGLRGQSRGHR